MRLRQPEEVVPTEHLELAERLRNHRVDARRRYLCQDGLLPEEIAVAQLGDVSLLPPELIRDGHVEPCASAAGDLVAEISARRTEAKNILNGPVAADVAGRLVFLSLTDAYARRDDGATFPVVKRLILLRSMVTGRLD